MQSPARAEPHANPQLGLWDTVSVIVGIVVGVSIFKAPAQVFSGVSTPWEGLGVWVLGGGLSLAGALCYSELATTYPSSGGDYVYLTRAFGARVGFLFGWAHLTCTLTGSIGAMAYVFADYAVRLFGLDLAIDLWLAAGSVIAFTTVNAFGITAGKPTQNVLTIVKVLGLLLLVAAGVGAYWIGSTPAQPSDAATSPGAGFGLAMIFVLYTYGGWNDAVFVAAEVRQPRINMRRALVLGVVCIAVIYLLVNLAYLVGLGFGGVRTSKEAPAADLLASVFGRYGEQVMSLLVMLSALGAINALIFTGSRIYAKMGEDHVVFSRLSYRHPRWNSPMWSLAVQGVFTLSLMIVVATTDGRSLIDRAMTGIGLQPAAWERFAGGFDTLVSATAPVFWMFFLLAGLSLFVLRVRDDKIDRPFRVPMYPLIPLVFCAMCGYMLYASVQYAGVLTLVGMAPVLLGLPLYAVSRLAGRRTPDAGNSA